LLQTHSQQQHRRPAGRRRRRRAAPAAAAAAAAAREAAEPIYAPVFPKFHMILGEDYWSIKNRSNFLKPRHKGARPPPLLVKS
jgi:hypothetical protein